MMPCCRERRMIIWSLCLIFFSISNSTLVFTSPTKHLCRQDQKDTLWEFKKEFHVDFNVDKKTKKWTNNTDCCSWDGITCDPKTGKVVKLHLHLGGSFLNGPLRSNSCLFKLHHLQSLNLSKSNLMGTLPDSIGNLKYLRYLSLDGCNLFGKIPSSLGNLSYLTILDLHTNGFTGELPYSIGSLNRLTKLRLQDNKLSGSFPRVLLNLSSLTVINLGSNGFDGILPSNMSSLSELVSLCIDGNSFSGPIPSSLFMIPSLIHLYMRRNHFTGPLEISSPSKLQSLSLGENNFSGSIPRSISKLTGLTYLDLFYWNMGSGGISDFSIFLHLKSLIILDLSYMNTRNMVVDLSLFSHLVSLDNLDLSGMNLKISSDLRLPSSIRSLTLSSCRIVEFPKFLQTQKRLNYLDISVNGIKGQVPEWLWRLPELQYVNVSQNRLRGFQGSIRKNGELIMLDISSNTFQDPLPLLPYSTRFFAGSNNRFSGEIPRTICGLVSLDTLILSNNNFNGSIPRCFENFNTTLVALHLQHNNLSGNVPEEAISVGLRSFDVGHNKLSGELPKSLVKCIHLEFLNVEDNKIKDKFPFWLSPLPDLQVLVLRSNEFYGPIASRKDPLSFPKLRIFDISGNRFAGVLPSDYFASWIAISSDVQAGPGSGYYHKSVALTNKGSNMELVGSGFTIYKTIDVSRNRLQGDIPESIGLLKELIVLNMSNNVFTGRVPRSLSNLSNLQSLDLSRNRLTGEIPPELGKLTFLAWMNFSYNKLEGPIPQGTQFHSQNSSSFAENLGLCGVPLLETCGGSEEEATKEDWDGEEDDDQVLSWIAAIIGCVPGVFCGLTIGHILGSYIHDWFITKTIFHSSS